MYIYLEVPTYFNKKTWKNINTLLTLVSLDPWSKQSRLHTNWAMFHQNIIEKVTHSVKVWWLIKWMGTLSLCLLNYALYKTVLKTTDPEHEILKAISPKSFPRGGASFLILVCCIFVKRMKLLLPLSFGFSSTFLSNASWSFLLILHSFLPAMKLLL